MTFTGSLIPGIALTPNYDDDDDKSADPDEKPLLTDFGAILFFDTEFLT